MRRANRKTLIVTFGLTLALAVAWAGTAKERANRRAYDGAPPTIPHQNFGMDCVACHGMGGTEIEGVGVSPPSPHGSNQGAFARCKQCHVFGETNTTFVDNSFSGLRQDLRRGKRAYPGAPPRIPHKVHMRENCAACHTGPQAREEIRTSHPERQRCVQCHVPIKTTETFDKP